MSAGASGTAGPAAQGKDADTSEQCTFTYIYITSIHAYICMYYIHNFGLQYCKFKKNQLLADHCSYVVAWSIHVYIHMCIHTHTRAHTPFPPPPPPTVVIQCLHLDLIPSLCIICSSLWPASISTTSSSNSLRPDRCPSSHTLPAPSLSPPSPPLPPRHSPPRPPPLPP